MYWTYDPLVARNAFLNLMKLGARPEEYVVDFYGDSTGSTLHGELGTDRLIVAWSLVDDTHAQPKAAAPVSADVASGPPIVNPQDARGAPQRIELPAGPEARIEIPFDIHDVMEHEPDVALAWRATTRRAFTWYLGRGYRIVGFASARDSGRCFYTLRATET